MQKVGFDTCLVSVIVPVHNAEKYIEETIQSVLNQTYNNWELILVNDGSTDRTINVLDKYSTTPHIKVIHQKNGGVSSARNAGAQQAQGNNFCFLDADDLLTENCLEKRVDFLRENECHFVHNDIEIILDNGERTGRIQSGLNGNVLSDLLRWERTVVPGPSSIIVSKQCFDSIGGFDENLSTAADQDFFIRVAKNYRIDRIPMVLTLYRVHEQNMHKNIPLMESDHIEVFKKAARNMLFNSFWFKQYCFSNLYFILASSWWGDGRNKSRSLSFILLAIVTYPPVLLRMIKKIVLIKNSSALNHIY